MARAAKGKEVAKSKKATSSKPSYERKSGIDFVKAAAARMDAASAEKKLAEEKDRAEKEALKRKEQAEKKKTREEKRKRRDELELEEEIASDEDSVDDEASEYEPTQADGVGDKKVSVAKRSPRPTRRSSSKINEAGKKKMGKAQPPVEEAATAKAPAVAPRRRKKAGQTKNTRVTKGLELEDEAPIPADLDACSEDTTKTCGGKKSKPNNGRKEEGADEVSKVRTKSTKSRGKTCLGDDALGGDGGAKVMAAKTKSRSTRSKASESNNGKKTNVDMEQGDEASRGKTANASKGNSVKDKHDEEEAAEAESLNVDCSNSLYDGALEVEYHAPEDEDDGTVYTRNMFPMTQVAMSFSDQGGAKFSPDSSNPGVEDDNQASARVAREEGADSDAAKKLKFCELNTREVSKMRVSQFMDQSFASSYAAEESITSAKTHNTHDDDGHNKLNGNCLELTTRGLSGMDPEALLAAIQTHPHTQHSSTISPETKASVMEDEEVQRGGRTASLGGTENSATINSQHESQSGRNGEEESEKMRPEEIARALQDMGRHVAAIGKIWKQLSKSVGPLNA